MGKRTKLLHVQVDTEHALEEADACQGGTGIREKLEWTVEGQERERGEVQATGELKSPPL